MFAGHGKPSLALIADPMTRHWIYCRSEAEPPQGKLISAKTLKPPVLGRLTPMRRERKRFQCPVGRAVKVEGSQRYLRPTRGWSLLVFNAGAGRRGGASSFFPPFILVVAKYKLKSERI